MALISYLIGVPRYKDTTLEDVMKIEKYCSWKKNKEINKENSNLILKEWCGMSENELPSKDVIEFYEKYYEKRNMFDAMLGWGSYYNITSQLARIVKANHIHNWFVKKLMNGKQDEKYHEVSRDQLVELLELCEEVYNKGIEYLGKDKYGDPEYKVNAEIAKDKLPIMSGFMFGPTEYDSGYAILLVEAAQTIAEILDRTNFEEYAIYYIATY